ncbi:MAG TPA: hypothetical protein ENJ32_08810 [Crenotrichaceae bacterium]|nr:hypothetical protein [Crenotrichaceae bacterium]
MTTPGFFTHIVLISQFELRRLFTKPRGLLYLLTFAVVWLLILYYPIRFASRMIVEGQRSVGVFRIFEFFGFDSLLFWQIPEFGVFWYFALLIFPSLSIFIAADQTCLDRERGTLRVLGLRTTRDRLFFGRFAGVMLIQTILMLVTLLSTLVLVVFRESALVSPGLNSILAILVNLSIVVMPFTALMAVLSAALKSSRQATIWGILILSFLSGIIGILSNQLPLLAYLKVLIPGYQLTELGRLAQWESLQLAYIPVLQTIVLLAIGRWIMGRQSL